MKPQVKKRIRSLTEKIENNIRKQKELHNANNDLQFEINKLTDYREKTVYKNKKLKTGKRVLGRSHWKEKFYDESDKKKFVIVECSELCSIDGKPCDGFGNLFQYYKL